jgi:hypothetical protein
MDWLAIGEPVLVPDAGSASPPHLHNVGYSRPANITYKLDLFCFNDSYRLVVSSSKCNIGFNRMKYRFPISLEIKRVFRQEEFSWALPAQ